jgi:hypothetical protein
MRIVIDMQGLQTRASSRRGVGRYTENLIREMLRLKTRHEFYLALNGALPAEIDRIRGLFKPLLPSEERIITWHNHCETSADIHGGSAEVAAAEIVHDAFLNAIGPDLIFSTNFARRPLRRRGDGRSPASALMPCTARRCTMSFRSSTRTNISVTLGSADGTSRNSPT